MKTNKPIWFFILILLQLIIICNAYGQGFICAVGGGSENYNDWSNAPYSWIVQKSDSGKIIIIDVADATSWLPNYFISLGASSAYNKTISSISAANLQSTYDELITAKAVFIRGGDQWDYIRLWKGTKVDSAINYIFQNGGVISGTSAGAAVLGEVDFSARFGSVYSDEALLNPFNSYMQFESNFLKLAPNVLFDTHFIERARHGRLIGMLYNRYFSSGQSLLGIGIDDRTAFCISPDGIGEVMGSGAVSFFTIDAQTNLQPISSNNYTIEKLKCDQLTNGWKYDIINKQIAFIPSSAKEVDTLRTWEMPITDFWLTGSNSFDQPLGNGFLNFLLAVNINFVIVISHPEFAVQLTPLTDFLYQTNLPYQVVYITDANLNQASIRDTILNATCFVFAGDSLSVLSKLKDTSTTVGQAFKQKTAIQKTPVFLFGKTGKTACGFYTDHIYTDMYTAYRGKMTNNFGLNLFGDFIFESSLFDNSDFYENRMSSVLWGLMHNRIRLGVYLHNDAFVVVNSTQKIIHGYGNTPPIFVDASKTTLVDSSTYRASGSIGPRQVVAMNNLRYGISTYDNISYSIGQAKFVLGTLVEEDQTFISTDFVLFQNYPNPFNPSTKIKYRLLTPQNDQHEEILAQINIYDVMGRHVTTLVNEYQKPGTYQVEFDASQFNQLSSGIYFYRMTAPNFSKTKSMVLLK